MSRSKPDRRVIRTDRSLHRALNSLILEKGYEATSIKDITGHAKVGRSTFYAHHGSKEALMLSGLQHLRAVLLATGAKTRGEKNIPLLAFSAVFFEHVYEYRDILQALLTDKSAQSVTRKIKRMLTDVVQEEFQTRKAPPPGSSVPRGVLVQFAVETCFTVLLWWLEHDTKMPAAKADHIFRRLVLPALEANSVP